MPLDFGHTCPDIDKEIDYLKGCFFSAIEGLLEQYNGVDLSTQDIKDIANDYKNDLYSDAEQCFEGVRKTNEEMRSVAGYKIDELEREIEDLKGEVEDLTNSLLIKDDEIEALNSELLDVNEQLRDVSVF